MSFADADANTGNVQLRIFNATGICKWQTAGQSGERAEFLDDGQLRENPTVGFQSYPAKESGEKMRLRPESFADHYSQARMFYRSMTKPEQRHSVGRFAFELGKCMEPKNHHRRCRNIPKHPNRSRVKGLHC